MIKTLKTGRDREKKAKLKKQLNIVTVIRERKTENSGANKGTANEWLSVK